jgi:hypothetical protein
MKRISKVRAFSFLNNLALFILFLPFWEAGCNVIPEDIVNATQERPKVTIPVINTGVVTPGIASKTPSKMPTIIPTNCSLQIVRPKLPEETSSTISITGGRKFYYDSVSGNDNNSGIEPDRAWQSLRKINSMNYLPGDVISFKRGSTWTGDFFIWASGSKDNPITFTSYGDSGELPVFRNPGSDTDLTSAIRINSDWVVVENLEVKEAQLAGIYISEGADNNIVRNIEATLVGEGLSVHGRYNQILGNYIHDLTMVHNTRGGNDDYGAVGIWLFNSNNEVAYNSLINCRASSYDYGEDGGAVEFYKDVNNSYIHHNYAYNAEGFMEIGGGSAINNIAAYNLIVNSGKVMGFHLAGKFVSQIKNFRFENNTIINTSSEKYSAAINFWWGNPDPGMLIMRNNIFYLKNFEGLVFSAGDSSNFTHDHNIYFMPEGKPGIKMGTGEIKADPDFVNLKCGDYRLKDNSPAVDAGSNLGYTLDFLNNPVFIGKTSDIGAIEYQGK